MLDAQCSNGFIVLGRFCLNLSAIQLCILSTADVVKSCDVSSRVECKGYNRCISCSLCWWHGAGHRVHDEEDKVLAVVVCLAVVLEECCFLIWNKMLLL
jgi:hypothetical protein